jgi:hypothetical protein
MTKKDIDNLQMKKVTHENKYYWKNKNYPVFDNESNVDFLQRVNWRWKKISVYFNFMGTLSKNLKAMKNQSIFSFEN